MENLDGPLGKYQPAPLNLYHHAPTRPLYVGQIGGILRDFNADVDTCSHVVDMQRCVCAGINIYG